MKRSKLKQREQKATQRLETARPKVSNFARKKSQRVAAWNRQSGKLQTGRADVPLMKHICILMVVLSFVSIVFSLAQGSAIP